MRQDTGYDVIHVLGAARARKSLRRRYSSPWSPSADPACSPHACSIKHQARCMAHTPPTITPATMGSMEVGLLKNCIMKDTLQPWQRCVAHQSHPRPMHLSHVLENAWTAACSAAGPMAWKQTRASSCTPGKHGSPACRAAHFGLYSNRCWLALPYTHDLTSLKLASWGRLPDILSCSTTLANCMVREHDASRTCVPEWHECPGLGRRSSKGRSWT